ncbi:MAG TPA: hypothetical protein VFU19_11430 [Iamia sp.]|nr:hypothetical protein [Iamia sp.]
MAASKPPPMLHLRVDVDQLDEDWWIDATLADRGAWLTASLLCKRRMTDGVVSRRLLAREGIDDEQVQRLVDADRFEVTDDDQVLVIGFTDTNMTRAEYEAKKAADRERQARSRARRSATEDPSGVSHDGVTRDDSATGRDPALERASASASAERERLASAASAPARVDQLTARLAQAKVDDEKRNAGNPAAFEQWVRTTWRHGEARDLVTAALTEHPDHDDDAIFATLTRPSTTTRTTVPADESQHPVLRAERLERLRQQADPAA